MLKENTQATDLILNKNEGKIKTFPGDQKTRDFPTNNPSLEKSLKDILEKGGRKKKTQKESSEIRLIIKETGKDAGEAEQMLPVCNSKGLSMRFCAHRVPITGKEQHVSFGVDQCYRT